MPLSNLVLLKRQNIRSLRGKRERHSLRVTTINYLCLLSLDKQFNNQLSLLIHINTKELRYILFPVQCTNNFCPKLMMLTYKYLTSIELKQNHNCILDILTFTFVKLPLKQKIILIFFAAKQKKKVIIQSNSAYTPYSVLIPLSSVYYKKCKRLPLMVHQILKMCI